MDKIALYMRLSKEDDRIQDESNSIMNQRAMLKRYIRGQKDLINKPVVEFVDDGISGKTVNRPGLQEMLEGVKKREITTILVKDISRFSRDYAHPAIISREDFEMVEKKREQNVKSGRKSWGQKRVNERHILSGKVICGNCGHAMIHLYNGKPKYRCRQRFFSNKMPEFADCVSSVRDEDLEAVILTMLQMEADLSLDYEKIRQAEQQKNEEKAKKAEKHLREMMATKEKLLNDTREAYESYKMGLTDKETYLVQKSSYDSMLKKLSDSISKQEQAVDVLRSEQAEYEKKGIQIGEEGVKFENADKPTEGWLWRLVDAFVKEVRVYAKDQIEIVWSFSKPEVE